MPYFHFHASTWTLIDVDDEEGGEDKEIRAYVTGRTSVGKNIILTIKGFEPTFALESDGNPEDIEKWMQDYISLPTETGWEKVGESIKLHKEQSVISIWGYQGPKKTVLYTFRCKTLDLHKRVISQLNYRKNYFLDADRGKRRFPAEDFTLFSIQDPLHEICLVTNTTHQGWIEFESIGTKLDETEQGILYAECNVGDIRPYTLKEDDPIYAPKCRLFFDLETFSSRENTMECDPTLEKDVIFMIAVTIEITNEPQITELLYLYPPKDEMSFIGTSRNKLNDELAVRDNYKQVGFKTLSNMMLYFANLFVIYRPNETYGFNTGQFDWNYTFKTVTRLGIADEFCKRLSILGAMEDIGIQSIPCRLEDRRTVSKQKGEQIFQVLICPGVVDIDILPFIRDQPNKNKDQYLDYKLSTVYQLELGMKMKKDMTYIRIYDAWRSRNLEELKLVAEYAVYDTRPLATLVDQVAIYERLAGVSSIAAIPIEHVLYRGISLLCYNVLYNAATSISYGIPYRPIKPGQDTAEDEFDPFSVGIVIRDDDLYEEDDERIEVKYEGATVLDVEEGTHTDPTATLDFESLYPSNMDEHNLCYTSIILQNSPSLIEYANSFDGGFTLQEWSVPRLKCKVSGIQYENEETAIEGTLHGLEKYTVVRADVRKVIDIAFEQVSPQIRPENTVSSAEGYDELEKRFWSSLGSSVAPEHATSKNLSSMMRKLQMICTKLTTQSLRSTQKRPYIRIREQCANLMSEITKMRKEAKSIVDEMEIFMAPKSAMIVEKAAKLLPVIQKKLKVTRNYWKSEMKKVSKGSARHKAADSAQLGAKLIMNSLYGFAGSKFPLPMTIIAELTTAIGRRNIKTTKEFCEQAFATLATNELVWDKNHEKKWPKVAKEGQLLWDADKQKARGPLCIKVIGGDTDSVFAKFYGCTILETIALSTVMANECTKRNFKPPTNLEYEKVSCPCVIIARKNRSEYVYEHDDKKKELKHKGNFMVKRKYCGFLKELGEKMIRCLDGIAPIDNPILDAKKILEPAQDRILGVLQNELWKLHRGQVSWDDLCVSAAFSSKVGEKTAVGRLAKKLTNRNDPAFRISERFRMVYVDAKSIAKYCTMIVATVDDSHCSEKLDFISEHPDLTKDWTPNGIWYLGHISNPILSLAKVLTLPNQVESNNVFLGKVIQTLKNFEVIAAHSSKGQQTISSFFSIGIPKEPDWKDLQKLDPESRKALFDKDWIWFEYMLNRKCSLSKSKIKQ